MKAVWIVDDDRSIRWVLEKALSRAGFPYRSFVSAREALIAMEEDAPQVLLTDIRMSGASGLELLEQVKQRWPSLPVIVMTAYSDLESAVSSFQGGAFEYLPKPFDVDVLTTLIRRAIDESISVDRGVQEVRLGTPEILGQAAAMQDVFRAIGRLSQSQVTVMITGESGSGKELVARALHRHSVRAKGPFVAINMAAIPKDLLESELFGHERGAFTGAQQRRQGRFEQANEGTLFLDEIGDMPPELQTRLLRVLSDGSFYRVGGHEPIQTRVRIIAATHQPLEERVRQGLFREDLFHRLNVIRLRLPALRERTEDIPLLTHHFLARCAQELGVEAKQLTPAALAQLQAFSFPGNVRQLENICHWLTVMSPAQKIDFSDLPDELLNRAPTLVLSEQRGQEEGGIIQAGGMSTVLEAQPWLTGLEEEVERLLAEQQPDIMDQLTRALETVVILAALRETRGRRIEAAQRLGIGRNTITRKIQDLDLDAQR